MLFYHKIKLTLYDIVNNFPSFRVRVTLINVFSNFIVFIHNNLHLNDYHFRYLDQNNVILLIFIIVILFEIQNHSILIIQNCRELNLLFKLNFII